jgi:hypothetical protein
MNCIDCELAAAVAELPFGLGPEHVKSEVDGRQQSFLIAEFKADGLGPQIINLQMSCSLSSLRYHPNFYALPVMMSQLKSNKTHLVS